MWDWAGAVLVFSGDGKSVSEMFCVFFGLVRLVPAQMRRCLDASLPAAHCPLPRDGYGGPQRGKSVKRGRASKVWLQATRVGPRQPVKHRGGEGWRERERGVLLLRTLALNRHRNNQRHLRRLEKRPDPATAMLSRDETRGKETTIGEG